MPSAKITFLFSDTGGGHRNAAEAIIAALQEEFGTQVTAEMVDFFKNYAPLPFNYMPSWYPYMVKTPQLWGLGFYMSNGKTRAQLLTTALRPYVQRATRKLTQNHRGDMIVSVHPLANSLILDALGRRHPPFVTVVTDMVSTHALWFDRRADMTLVPTRTARQNALAQGLASEQVFVTGQPIHPRYAQPPGDKPALRARLGWPQDKFIVLAVGGGDGMGPLGAIAAAIAEADLPDLALVIVTGRNARLKSALESKIWPLPTFIYGYTREMPDFMRAADVLVTKAGPGTIAEALAAHLPLILFARLPGQEDGNVRYVQATRTGVWAPTPRSVVATLAYWLDNPSAREEVVQACQRAARPQAARTIARLLGARLGLLSREKALASLPDTSREPSIPGREQRFPLINLPKERALLSHTRSKRDTSITK